MSEPSSQLPMPLSGDFLLYQTEDGQTRLQVRLERETVWLTQAHMAELFQRERSVITKHIRNIFEEGELEEKAVCANYAQTAADGKTYNILYYNLDVIISVGYRGDREILTHAGKVSHEKALAKAEVEFEKYRALEAARPSPVEKDFANAVEQVKQLENEAQQKKKPKL